MKRLAIVPLLAATASCNSDQAFVTGGSFDPVTFFSGHTQGKAQLRTIFGESHAILIDSHGTADGARGFVLDQAIVEQGSLRRTRRWVLHPAGLNHWSGTLTDARGPVLVERTASDVVIRYRMKNGASVEQHLKQPPGGPVDNRMAVSRFGVRIASLHEQIRKLER